MLQKTELELMMKNGWKNLASRLLEQIDDEKIANLIMSRMKKQMNK